MLNLRWLAHQSRETRDTLLMLGMMTLVLAPLAVQLPVWCSLLVAALLTWRASLAVLRRPLPSRIWLLGLLVLSLALIGWQYRSWLGRDPGVSLISLLLVLKSLEWHRRRDAFVLFFLSFFALLTQLFYSQALTMALYMMLCLWAWMTVLILMHRPVGRPRVWHAARTAAWMSLVGTPLVVVLFVLFPRVAPLWSLPSMGDQGRSGLSGSMQIGRVAQLALDDSVAMRIAWLDPSTQTPTDVAPDRSLLYFRGPVLSLFDGKTWEALPDGGFSRMPIVQTTGPVISYQVTLEPHGLKSLLTLDFATQPPELSSSTTGVRPQADGQWVMLRNIDSLLRYSARSSPQYLLDAPGRSLNRGVDTLLPDGFNPRTLAMGQEWRKTHPPASPRELAQLAMERLRTQGYLYTLEPGSYGPHSADEFWFDRKQGFCEHISAAFVVLMRAMQVPARIVTGYQGGERNPLDGLWTVRQSDAHAWAEIWQAGEGWIRIDPTAAVAPDRVGELTRLRPRPGLLGEFIGAAIRPESNRWLQSLRSGWEAANHLWNQRVISFQQKQQFNLLENLGMRTPSWQDLVRLLGGLLAVAALLGVALTRSRRERPDPWQVLLSKARQELIRRGMPSPAQPHLSPAQLARAAQSHWESNWASQGQALAQWLLDMEQHRYAAPPPQAARSAHPVSSLGLERRRLAPLELRLRRLQWPERLRPTP